MTKQSRHRNRSKQCNAKQSESNDLLLINANLINEYGINYESNPKAWNVKLRYLGTGVDDDRTRTKYFCVSCGWRMYLDDTIFRCSNWPACKNRCWGCDIKKGRGRAMEARKRSLDYARKVIESNSL